MEATLAHEVVYSLGEIAKHGKDAMWHIAEFGFSGTEGPNMCLANDIKAVKNYIEYHRQVQSLESFYHYLEKSRRFL